MDDMRSRYAISDHDAALVARVQWIVGQLDQAANRFKLQLLQASDQDKRGEGGSKVRT